jgi:two-component system, response regulator PdtaR
MTTPPRVAVADDERDIREYLQEALTRLGWQVEAAATGRELVDLCRRSRPDLIVTDIKMPDMDGIEAAAAANCDAQIPVILVSAHHDADLLGRLEGVPILGYLVKPITEAHLKAAIAVAMTRFRHFIALKQEAADLRQALEDRKVIERAKGVLMRRLGVDEEEAFRRLRKSASSKNLKLVEMSRQVIAAETVFSDLDAT